MTKLDRAFLIGAAVGLILKAVGLDGFELFVCGFAVTAVILSLLPQGSGGARGEPIDPPHRRG